MSRFILKDAQPLTHAADDDLGSIGLQLCATSRDLRIHRAIPEEGGHMNWLVPRDAITTYNRLDTVFVDISQPVCATDGSCLDDGEEVYKTRDECPSGHIRVVEKVNVDRGYIYGRERLCERQTGYRPQNRLSLESSHLSLNQKAGPQRVTSMRHLILTQGDQTNHDLVILATVFCSLALRGGYGLTEIATIAGGLRSP
ncbi:hypothetical protein BU16DRAFT_619435 [Lophium mytilinum]|uniref:Uncharacterized protein n=1 Tax=Lophium mytilinum TaxID=390894 RepID=A0A6A6QQ64_9PEZI|nr:hypothetical protein BU16DRAFT_619435 [Lophium mytilinum]